MRITTMAIICKHTSSVSMPSEWVKDYTKLIPPDGNVLDLACGSGRHTRFLLERGIKVTALDHDISQLKDMPKNENLIIIEHDLEGSSPWPFASQAFAGIVVVNYLYRPLFVKILDSLAPNGVLIYQTFAVGNEKYGRPRNPQYLLSDEELLKVFGKHLHVVQYSHGLINQPSPAIMQSICCINYKTQNI